MDVPQARAVAVVAPWMAETRCSVIVPILNEESGLTQRLQVLREWCGAHELIVVDGGSSDASAEIARSFANKFLLSTPGRARQMNLGAATAQGDILLFLHCDTLPEFTLEDFIRAATNCDWGFCRVRLRGDGLLLRMIETSMNLRSRLTHVATGDQMMFVRRIHFEAHGGFQDIPLMEDVELSKRLRKRSDPLTFNGRVGTSSRRWRVHGSIRTVLMMWQLRLLYWLGLKPQRLHRRYYGETPKTPFLLMQFAREPVPGEVKTRLQPPLSAEQAADLHSAMVVQTTDTLCNSRLAPVHLWVSGEPAAALFTQCRRLGVAQVRVQGPGDLGARMAQAFQAGLQCSLGVILVGSDAPSIDADYLQDAARQLQDKDLVLGPALDGGYVLIALKRFYPGLFEDIEWGSDRVLEATLRQARELNLEVGLLNALADIDRPEDLRLLPENLRRSIPASAMPPKL
jgi:rSAM/selenodomain-associated transferase 2/rSAM/selenodomain-associated transferase 1